MNLIISPSIFSIHLEEESQFFPIHGELRYALLGLEVVIAFASFQYFLLFISRYVREQQRYREFQSRKERTTTRTSRQFLEQVEDALIHFKNRELSWGFMFFFLGLMYVVYIIGDFYAGDQITRQVFVLMGYLFFQIGILILSYSIEKNELKETRFFYSRLFLLIFIVLIITTIVSYRNAYYVSTSSIPLTFVLLIHYSRIMILRSRGLRKMKTPIYSLFIGFISLLSGFILTTDFSIIMWGYVSRLIGDLIQLLGLALIAIAFYFLPSFFTEFDWVERIRALYVIHPSGISLYFHNFRENEEEEPDKPVFLEEDLTTGAIVAIKSIIQDMSNKKKSNIQSIKMKDFILLMEHGKKVIVVLLSEIDSLTLREKIKAFCTEFEKRFGNELDSWYGNVEIFKEGGDLLISRIFRIQS